jgi:hypothetical protein
MPAGLRRPAMPTQFIARIIVPGTMRLPPPQFSAFFAGFWEPVEAMGVSYSGTSPTGKLPSSIRIPPIKPETFQ